MKIFEPITINHLKIKNRLMVSAMVTNYCKENGYPTEKFIAYPIMSTRQRAILVSSLPKTTPSRLQHVDLSVCLVSGKMPKFPPTRN